MVKAGIDASYEYNWNSLVGCLQGMLRQAGLPHDAARVSAVTGEAFRVPAPARGRAGDVRSPVAGLTFDGSAPDGPVPDDLPDDLALLGLRVRVDAWDLRRRRPALLGRRVGRRIRGALSDGRAVAAYGAVTGEFGLLVGYDASRRAYRVQGALSQETGEWLRADRLPTADAAWLALVIPESDPLRTGPAAMPALLARAVQRRLRARPGEGLAAWVALLRSRDEIDAGRHARVAQALAAGAGEAARFWRTTAEDGVQAAEPLVGPGHELAVALSRVATLFPFPMGGDVAGGGREAGALALAAAIAVERRLDALLASFPAGTAGPATC